MLIHSPKAIVFLNYSIEHISSTVALAEGSQANTLYPHCQFRMDRAKYAYNISVMQDLAGMRY